MRGIHISFRAGWDAIKRQISPSGVRNSLGVEASEAVHAALGHKDSTD